MCCHPAARSHPRFWEAAFAAHGDAYEVLSEEFIAFLKKADLESKENWFLQGVRQITTAMMSNPSCTAASGDLKIVLRKVNAITRARYLI